MYGWESTGLPTAVSRPTVTGDFVGVDAVDAVDVEAVAEVEAAAVVDVVLLLLLLLPQPVTTTTTHARIAIAIGTRSHLGDDGYLITILSLFLITMMIIRISISHVNPE